MSSRNTSADASTDDFWYLMSRMYKNMDLIRESSHRITDLSTNLQSFITHDHDLAAYSENDNLDLTPVKEALGEIKKEVNSILSYAHELSPHLQNPSAVPSLSKMAELLLWDMNWPGRMLYLKLKDTLMGCDFFAQTSNCLILNPTKKSLKAAFGLDIGIEQAKLKAYLESYRANF